MPGAEHCALGCSPQDPTPPPLLNRKVVLPAAAASHNRPPPGKRATVLPHCDAPSKLFRGCVSGRGKVAQLTRKMARGTLPASYWSERGSAGMSVIKSHIISPACVPRLPAKPTCSSPPRPPPRPSNQLSPSFPFPLS